MGTRSSRICCAAWRWIERTRCGPWTSPTFRWHAALSIWLLWWTGLAGGCSPGRFPSRWRSRSASTRSKQRLSGTASRQFSTPTRGANSPVLTSPACCRRTRSPSAWMAEAPGVTTCSSSASGVRSNTRRSTCVPTTASLRRVPRSVGISTSTIPLHHTHLAMSLMRRDFAVRVLVLWGPLRVVLRGGCWPWSLACREQRDRIATDHLEVDGSR